MMSSLLGPYIGKFVFVFIDDIIVFSKSLKEHIEHLKKIFEICNAANLRFKLSKCRFFEMKVEYLGHQVSSKGVEPTKRNIEKIMKIEPPKDVGGVRTLLGLTNYYRRYIESYAERMSPIIKLLKKNQEFVWCEEQTKALEDIKQALTNPPILAYPDRNTGANSYY
jgi:hypothetical protein